MDLRIALAGNPNCGKTTLFNALTGSNQFVGNWPGVTVEKKEGKLKKHDGVVITDLPGIYSLSPYTLEEVVARNYLIGERPDAILNIVDGTNLERNLYLTTQLTELGIPVVVAINMMDIVRKNGDKINIPELSRGLGCKIAEISALKGNGVTEAAEAAIDAAKNAKTVPMHTFSGPVEHAIAHIEEAAVASITGLVAKENIVGTLGIFYGGGEASVYQNIAAAFTSVSGFSFLTFNLLCAPCFAAIGAIKREMNSAKWTVFAILYQCGFAYAISLMINQIGSVFTGNLNIIGLIVAILLLAGMLYMLFKPYKESTKLNKRVKI